MQYYQKYFLWLTFLKRRVCENVHFLRKLHKLKNEHKKFVKKWFCKKVESKKKNAILSKKKSNDRVFENGEKLKVGLAEFLRKSNFPFTQKMNILTNPPF